MVTKDTVISWMESLACSQGFYGRMLRDFNNLAEESQDAFIDALNEAGVKDSLDFVMFVEC